MKNLHLLAELVKFVKEKKHVLKGEIAILYEKQTKLRTEQEKIANDIHQKESQLDSMSEKNIAEYQMLWDRSPNMCPLCYLFNNKKSDLLPLPERHHREHFKCRLCGKKFHVPLP